MGSPEFAVPVLNQLAACYTVVGVVTQPDRPAGRGNKLTAPPVKTAAEALSIPIIQPEKLKLPEALEQLTEWNPDVIVVAAFGQILRQNVLELPRYGCINVHASLLPRWRGASPIQAAIAAGDLQTGVTIMKMDKGVDTGPLFVQKAITIAANDTALSLSDRLAALGAELLIDTLHGYLAGTIIPQPQPDEGATYAALIEKEAGRLDFTHTAIELEHRVRAYNPWPVAFFDWGQGILKVYRAHVEKLQNPIPGSRRILAGFPAVSTSDGWLVLDEVQPSGKKVMSGKAFLLGARDWLTE